MVLNYQLCSLHATKPNVTLDPCDCVGRVTDADSEVSFLTNNKQIIMIY